MSLMTIRLELARTSDHPDGNANDGNENGCGLGRSRSTRTPYSNENKCRSTYAVDKRT